MKRIVMVFAAALLALSSPAQTQEHVIEFNKYFSGGLAGWKSIYGNFNRINGVSTMYISEDMLRMINKLPNIGIGGNNLDLTPFVKSLKLMYLIRVPAAPRIMVRYKSHSATPVPDAEPLSNILYREMTTVARDKKFKPFVEIKNDKDHISIYAAIDGDIVTGMSLFVEKAGEAAFLAFEGELPRKELEQVLKNVIE